MDIRARFPCTFTMLLAKDYSDASDVLTFCRKYFWYLFSGYTVYKLFDAQRNTEMFQL